MTGDSVRLHLQRDLRVVLVCLLDFALQRVDLRYVPGVTIHCQ